MSAASFLSCSVRARHKLNRPDFTYTFDNITGALSVDITEGTPTRTLT